MILLMKVLTIKKLRIHMKSLHYWFLVSCGIKGVKSSLRFISNLFCLIGRKIASHHFLPFFGLIDIAGILSGTTFGTLSFSRLALYTELISKCTSTVFTESVCSPRSHSSSLIKRQNQLEHYFLSPML